MTINVGKMVRLGSNAYLHFDPSVGSASASESGTEDFYYNINGTLDASQGGINLCTNTHTETVNKDQIFEFNVGPQGTVIVGDVVRKHVGKAGTTLNVNVAPGGSIFYNGSAYTTNQSAPGTLNNTAFSSNEITNSLLTSTGNYNLKFNEATTLSGDSALIVKGNYTQTANLSGKPITLSGDLEQTISAAGTNIPGLTINKSANKALLSTPLTTSALTLTKGNLHLQDNDLTIAAGGSITGGASASHIITDGTGALSQTVTSAGVNFPLGLSADSYDPVNIKPSGTNVFSARVYSPHIASPATGVRYNDAEWDIVSTATTATELKFTPFEAYEKTPYPVIGHYTGGAWVNSTASLSGNTYTGTFSSFSPFATGSSATPSALKQIDASFSYHVADGQLIVNGLNANDVVSVYNLNGQQIATTTAATSQASLRVDNAGVYIAKVKSNNTTNTMKIVISD
jgi:hypothetical protein